MTLVYGLAIALGAVGALAVAGAMLNPDRGGLGPPGRNALAGVLGFGLGGMSASFGGWSTGLSFAAALGGAALVIALAIRFSDGEG